MRAPIRIRPSTGGRCAGDVDQRMVEQAAIGVALAFCPAQVWEPLRCDRSGDRLVAWLQGIFEHEPDAQQLAILPRAGRRSGLERVGASASIASEVHDVARPMLDSRTGVGAHWLRRRRRCGNVDYYVPFAFHTYGLDLRGGERPRSRRRSARRRVPGARCRASPQTSSTGSRPTGPPSRIGRSLTYRFAMAGVLGRARLGERRVAGVRGRGSRGLLMRHLRWWADNGRSVIATASSRSASPTTIGGWLGDVQLGGIALLVDEGIGALAAHADHPFWTTDEEVLARLTAPVVIADAGQVITRGADHAVIMNSRPAIAYRVPGAGSGEVPQVRLFIRVRLQRRCDRHVRVGAHRLDVGLHRSRG